MLKRLNLDKLSIYQQKAVKIAFYKIDLSTEENQIKAIRIKRLLLRAFIIHKYYQQISLKESPEYLFVHLNNFQKRLVSYLEEYPQSENYIPYCLFIFFTETIQKKTYLSTTFNYFAEYSNNFYHTNSKREIYQQDKLCKKLLFHYHQTWIKLVRSYLNIVTKNSIINRLKNKLGCISLIPVKVGKEHIKIREICINYHDLYHLEVSQLDRIRMGKDWVSGIHGINATVFHNSTITEEYDSFLDEARIAIHEGLTRLTPFSVIKAFCWMTLLMLQGINPIAVLFRHIRSMKTKQEEFRNLFKGNVVSAKKMKSEAVIW